MKIPSAGQRFRIVAVTADGAVSAVPVRIMGVTVDAAHLDWKLELTNDADGAGANLLVLSGEAEGGQTDFDFVARGGFWFSSKCYCDITTTGGAAYFWLDD